MSYNNELIEGKIDLINDTDLKLLAEIYYLSAKLIEQKITELIYPELRIK